MSDPRQKYAVVGSPISHSLSPMIHNSWMQAAGLKSTYGAEEIPEGTFNIGLSKLERSGFKGLNVTLPHKHSALSAAIDSSKMARAIGAANTLKWLPEGGWYADNTDAPGFLDALSDSWTGDLSATHVFVLGAGGSSRAVVAALSDKAGALTVCNRTVSRATELAERFGASRALSLDDGFQKLDEADLIINTTSLGHSGTFPDLPGGQGRLFFDISYGKAADVVLSGAGNRGWRTADGLGMLVAQAALAFEIWFDIVPDRPRALQACRAAVSGAQA